MKRRGGFISTIVVIILALAAAKFFFDWDIFDAAETPEGQGTVVYIRRVLDVIWSYLAYPLGWLWENLKELIQNRGTN